MIRAVRAWSVFVRAVGGRVVAVSLDAWIVELEPRVVELRAKIEGLRTRNAELEGARGPQGEGLGELLEATVA